MNIIDAIFGHRHKFVRSDYVCHPSEVVTLSAAPITATVYCCRCGEERRELTPAGEQQVEWGDNIKRVLGLDA